MFFTSWRKFQQFECVQYPDYEWIRIMNFIDFVKYFLVWYWVSFYCGEVCRLNTCYGQIISLYENYRIHPHSLLDQVINHVITVCSIITVPQHMHGFYPHRQFHLDCRKTQEFDEIMKECLLLWFNTRHRFTFDSQGPRLFHQLCIQSYSQLGLNFQSSSVNRRWEFDKHVYEATVDIYARLGGSNLSR